MNTKNIALIFVAAALTAFSSCSKTDLPPPSGGGGGGGGNPPVVKQPQVRCYNATPLDLNNKHASMLCSASEVGATTVSACYDKTPPASAGFTNGQASLTCSGSPDVEPVNCVNKDKIAALDNFNAAVLCSNSGNDNSIACFNNTSLSLYDNEAAVMCQRAKTWDGPLNCFDATPLTLPESAAATLCSQTLGNGDVSLECYKQTPLSLSDEDAAILCQKSKSVSATLGCWENSPSYLSDHDAAILCSGGTTESAAKACIANTSTNMSNHDAAIMCSGADPAYTQKSIKCYNDTDVNLGESDAAVLCSSNNGLLTSMYSVNTQYNNRIMSRGQISRADRGQSLESLLEAFKGIDSEYSISGAQAKNRGQVRGTPKNTRGLQGANPERVSASAAKGTRKSKNVGSALAIKDPAAAKARISHIRGGTVALSDIRKNHSEVARRSGYTGSASAKGRTGDVRGKSAEVVRQAE